MDLQHSIPFFSLAVNPPVLEARRTRAHPAQTLPTVDAGVVTIIPNKPNRVIADREQLERFPAHQRGNQKDFGIGELAHLLMSTLTSRTGTSPPQTVERVRRHVSIRPVNRELLFRIIDGYAGRGLDFISRHARLPAWVPILFVRLERVPGLIRSAHDGDR